MHQRPARNTHSKTIAVTASHPLFPLIAQERKTRLCGGISLFTSSNCKCSKVRERFMQYQVIHGQVFWLAFNRFRNNLPAPVLRLQWLQTKQTLSCDYQRLTAAALLGIYTRFPFHRSVCSRLLAATPNDTRITPLQNYLIFFASQNFLQTITKQTINPLAESAPHQKDNSTNRFLTRVNPITHRYAEAALYARGYIMFFMFWQMFAFNRQRATFGQHRCRAQVGDAPRAQAALRVSPRAPMAAKASASRCCRCHRLPTPLQHPRC